MRGLHAEMAARCAKAQAASQSAASGIANTSRVGA
jgi:hypothetical protein